MQLVQLDELLLVDLDAVGAGVGHVHEAVLADNHRLRPAQELLRLQLRHVAQPVGEGVGEHVADRHGREGGVTHELLHVAPLGR